MVKPLRIIALLDGRAGHEKQTLGVIEALGKMTNTQTEYKHLTHLTPATTLRNWCRYLSIIIKKPEPPSNGPADLVIGTGSHTHLALLLLKNRTGAKAVTCMTPMFPLNRAFDLCLIPRHDRPRPAENIFVTTGPPSTARSYGTHAPDKGLILVGGIDEKSHRWQTPLVLKQIRSIIETTPGYHWTISSSPRTPEETSNQLQHLIATYPRAVFFDAMDTPRGWIETQYSESSVAWVTADSVSMVYEALTAGCAVGILPVQWKKPNNKFQRSIADLYAAGLAVSYDKWLSGTPLPCPGSPLNEADRCAHEILRRWWPLHRP